MVAVGTRNNERNGHLNGHFASAVMEQVSAADEPPLKEPAAVQRSPGAAAEPSTEAQHDAVATASVATEAGPKAKSVQPPKTSGAKPAKVKSGNRTTRPPKFRYVPQAELDAELARLEELSRAALVGDTQALDALRAELDHVPHVWRRLADLQLAIESRLIDLVAANDPLRTEAFRKRCSELRCELLERQPSSLATEMAASRVVATFMLTQLLEIRALQTPKELGNIKQLEQAERRFQAAMRTFLMARRSDFQLRQMAS